VAKRPEIYVKDLKKYLADHEMSPEDFAVQAQLSHMTIRRWLKKKGGDLLPSKYLPTLGTLFSNPGLSKSSLSKDFKQMNMDVLMAAVEANGSQFKDINQLKAKLSRKLKTCKSDKTFQRCCKELLGAATAVKSSLRAQSIARGALLYIVDAQEESKDAPLIAYFSELAVLSMALNAVYSLR
jgi:hypothetical protein